MAILKFQSNLVVMKKHNRQKRGQKRPRQNDTASASSAAEEATKECSQEVSAASSDPTRLPPAVPSQNDTTSVVRPKQLPPLLDIQPFQIISHVTEIFHEHIECCSQARCECVAKIFGIAQNPLLILRFGHNLNILRSGW